LAIIFKVIIITSQKEADADIDN